MEIDRLELLADGHIQIRYINKVYDINGNELIGQGTYHREVVDTEEDISKLPVDAQAAINAHWTPERKTARAAKRIEDAARIIESTFTRGR